MRWQHWEVRPWRTEDGTIGGVVVFTEDVSAEVAARHQVEALNLALERRVAERTAQMRDQAAELDTQRSRLNDILAGTDAGTTKIVSLVRNTVALEDQAASKRVIIEQRDWPIDQMFDLQEPITGAILTSQDAREGAAAFAERRAPVWKGQ